MATPITTTPAGDLVNVDSLDVVAPVQFGEIGLDAFEEVTLFTVPSGVRLVITDWRSTRTLSMGLFQDLSGTLTAKAGARTLFEPSLPMVFEPESLVVLKDLSNVAGQRIRLSFSGYLEMVTGMP